MGGHALTETLNREPDYCNVLIINKVEVWELSRLRANSALLASPAIGAFAPRSRTEVLIPSSSHYIPLREFGGGMGIRTPDLLIANETLYQLSYTPNTLNSQ